MWFTRVSLKNPVFATMVMLALVVLGLFAYQRLKVDQFPNIDFPVVVISTEYPGASPEIVESEVSKKIEEGVNSIAGINALTSRSYENQSVVIIEFQLHIDGRKAAEDVREKIALVPSAHVGGWLMGFGAVGLLGNWLGGRWVDRHPLAVTALFSVLLAVGMASSMAGVGR